MSRNTRAQSSRAARLAPALPQSRSQSGAVPMQRRVIFVNRYFHPDLSATSQMLSDLTQSLRGEDLELHVICSRQMYDHPTSPLARRERVGNTTVHRIWSTRFGRNRLIGRGMDYLTFCGCATLSMLKWARRGAIVVAMTDPPMISICAALVSRARGALLINWLQDVFPEVMTSIAPKAVPSWLVWPLRRARDWSLRQAHRNIVLSHRMQRLVAGLGVQPHKQRIIENWADGVALTPRPRQWSAIRRSVAADGDFVIQYSGNLGRAHDYKTILGAAEELRHEAKWLFLFVGGGANMIRLRAEAERRGLQNMRFLSYQRRDALADTLAAADVHMICLLPQLEGLIVPSKFYGVLAAGRPVIVIGDPDGEQACTVRAENCGVVVRVGDSAALVDELRGMRGNPEWLQEAALRARVLFERRYTLDRAAAKWARVLSTRDEP